MSSPSPDQLIQLPKGFSFSALAAGIKASGKPDLALILAAPGTTAAAVFTTNRVAAAPVQVGREHLKQTRGRVRAVIVNSGNANCATGNTGLRACRQVCKATARVLAIGGEEVIPSSTGIIGVPLPTEKILCNLEALTSSQDSTQLGLERFADAIMTTDTRQKLASATFRAGNSDVNVLGIAKGSGMIHPRLATMLVYLLTDLQASPVELTRLLKHSCDETFNCISIDGDTSTNDTVLLLASGRSKVRLTDAGIRSKFACALSTVCDSLAEQIVADGEGVKHVIRLSIGQARTPEEARQIAKTIAHSLLVKTAWAGADPNWGRILAAVGRSGISVDPNRVSIFIGKQKVCHHGTACSFDEREAHAHLAQPKCEIHVLVGRGRACTTFLTSDLTAEYVHINADYST